MNDNQLTLIGNLVTDPERRELTSGAVLTRFRVASTQRRFDKESGQWRDGSSTYLSVVCWRRLADNVAGSLLKGDPVIVQGRLASRSWERDGQRYYDVELEATTVGPDLARAVATPRRAPRLAPVATEQVEGPAGPDQAGGSGGGSGGGEPDLVDAAAQAWPSATTLDPHAAGLSAAAAEALSADAVAG